ncbi:MULTISPECIES: hypothetical protein [unclassified Micromonospora]
MTERTIPILPCVDLDATGAVDLGDERRRARDLTTALPTGERP